MESSSTTAQIKSLRNNNTRQISPKMSIYVPQIRSSVSTIMTVCVSCIYVILMYKYINYKHNKSSKSTNLTKKTLSRLKRLALPPSGGQYETWQRPPATFLCLRLHWQEIYTLSIFIQYISALHLTFVPLSPGFVLSSSSVAGWARPGCGRCRSAGSWRPPGPALSWSRLPEAYWPPPAFAPPSRSASAPLLPVTDEWNKEHSFNQKYQYSCSCDCHGYGCDCDAYCKKVSTGNCFVFLIEVINIFLPYSLAVTFFSVLTAIMGKIRLLIPATLACAHVWSLFLLLVTHKWSSLTTDREQQAGKQGNLSVRQSLY